MLYFLSAGMTVRMNLRLNLEKKYLHLGIKDLLQTRGIKHKRK